MEVVPRVAPPAGGSSQPAMGLVTAEVVMTDAAGDLVALGGGGGYVAQGGALASPRAKSGDERDRQEDDPDFEERAKALRHLFSECDLAFSRLCDAVLDECVSLRDRAGAGSCRGATTIGLIMDGLNIDGIAQPSAAADSKQLERGDRILSVDGVAATTQNFARLLTGCDAPGSYVEIQVCKSGSAEIRQVTLGRRERNDDARPERAFLRDILRTMRQRVAPGSEMAKLLDLIVKKSNEGWEREDLNDRRTAEMADRLESSLHARRRESRALSAALFRGVLRLEDECGHARQMSLKHETRREAMLRTVAEVRAVREQCEEQVADSRALHRKQLERLLARFSRRRNTINIMREHFCRIRDHAAQQCLRMRFLSQSLRRLLCTFVKKTLATTLRDWHEVAKKQERVATKLYRYLLRLVNHMAGRAFQMWVVNVRDQLRIESAGRIILRKTAGKRLFSAFWTWSSITTQQTRARDRISRVLLQIMNRTVLQALNSWIYAATRAAQLRALTRRVSRRRHRSILLQTLSILMQLQVSRQETKGMMMQVRCRGQRRTTFLAFDCWRHYRATQDRYKNILLRVLQRWEYSSKEALRIAWSEWALAVGTMRHMRATGSKVVQRIRQRSAWACLLRWQEAVGEVIHMRKVVLRIVIRMTQSCLTKALALWKTGSAEASQTRGQSTRALKLHSRLEGRMIEGGWARWCLIANEKRRRRHQGRIVATGRRRQCLFASWRALHVAAVLSKMWQRNLKRAQRKAALQRRPCQSRALWSWCYAIWRSKKILQMTVRRRVISLLSCLSSWVESLRLMRRYQRYFENLQHRLAGRSKAGIVRAWASFAGSAAYDVWLLKRAQGFWQLRHQRTFEFIVRDLLRAWCLLAGSSWIRVLRAIRLSLEDSRLRMSFDSWQQVASRLHTVSCSEADKERLSFLSRQKYTKKMMLSTFLSWHICRRKRVHLALRARLISRRRLIPPAFHLWSGQARKSSAVELLLVRALQRAARRRANDVILRWRCLPCAPQPALKWTAVARLCNRVDEVMAAALHRWALRTNRHGSTHVESATLRTAGRPLTAHSILRLGRSVVDAQQQSQECLMNMAGLEEDMRVMLEMKSQLNDENQMLEISKADCEERLAAALLSNEELQASLAHQVLETQSAILKANNLERCIEVVSKSMSLVLELDFKMVGVEGSQDRKKFQDEVTQDLAQAAGLPTSCFKISGLQPGSVKIALEVFDAEAGPSAADTVAIIEEQANDPGSKMRRGSGLLAKITSAEVVDKENALQRIATLQDELEAVKADKNKVISTINGEMYRLNLDNTETVSRLQQKLRQAMDAGDAMQVEVETWKQEAEARREKVAQMQVEVDSARAERDAMQKDFASQAAQVAALHVESLEHESQLRQAEANLATKIREIAETNKAQQETIQKYESAVQNEKRLHHDAEQAQRSIHIWRELVAETETLLEAERTKVACEQDLLAKAQQEHADARAALQGDLRREEEAKKELQRQGQELDSQLKSQAEVLESQQRVIVALEQQITASAAKAIEQTNIYERSLQEQTISQQEVLAQERSALELAKSLHDNAREAHQAEKVSIETDRDAALQALSKMERQLAEAQLELISCQSRIIGMQQAETRVVVQLEEVRHARERDVEASRSIRSSILSLAGASRRSVFPAPPTHVQHKFKSNTTLGITVLPSSLDIDQILVGGPAHNSGRLAPGDEIVAVDDIDVVGCSMEELTGRLIGDDVPGTFVKLTVIQRGVKDDVKLKRISSESLAERRRIFELINETKNESVRIRSPEVHRLMEDILQEWSDQLKTQTKHDEELAENLVRRDIECQSLLTAIASQSACLVESTDEDAAFWSAYNAAYLACPNLQLPTSDEEQAETTLLVSSVSISPSDLQGRGREDSRGSQSQSGETGVTDDQVQEALFGRRSPSWSIHSNSSDVVLRSTRRRALPSPPHDPQQAFVFDADGTDI